MPTLKEVEVPISDIDEPAVPESAAINTDANKSSQPSIPVDFGVSGTVLDLAAGFLSELFGVLSGVVGEDGVVTDGVVGGAFRGAFLRRVFGFPFGS